MDRARKVPASGKIQIKFTERQMDLLRDHTLMDDRYHKRLAQEKEGRKLVAEYTLDEIEDMIGFLAEAASHADSKRLEDQLDALADKLEKIISMHDAGSR